MLAMPAHGLELINGVETVTGSAVVGGTITGATITGGTVTGLATDIAVADGGTGVSTIADGGLVIGNAAGAIEADVAGLTTQVLVGGGALTKPVWTTATGSGAPARAVGARSTFAAIAKSADAVTLTAAECSNTLITNRDWDGADDQTLTLPAAAIGLKFKFLATVASGGTADTYFDTAGSTTNIYLDGTAIGAGVRIWTEEIAVGESLVAHTATLDGSTFHWFIDSVNGIWLSKGS